MARRFSTTPAGASGRFSRTWRATPAFMLTTARLWPTTSWISRAMATRSSAQWRSRLAAAAWARASRASRAITPPTAGTAR